MRTITDITDNSI